MGGLIDFLDLLRFSLSFIVRHFCDVFALALKHEEQMLTLVITGHVGEGERRSS